MAHAIEFDEGAGEDFDDAFDWYAKRSPGAAIGFASEIDATLAKIAADPERFPKTYAGCRYCALRRYPFSVVYYSRPGEAAEANKIVVIAIAHAKRRPGYWRHRR